MTAASEDAVALRPIWARIAVDPIAFPLARFLAARTRVTPNHVTTAAVACAVLSAVLFAVGEWRWAGLAFLARYFFDCLDGAVARERGQGSSVGAAYDLMADVGGIATIIAVAGWRLVQSEGLPPAIPLALLALVVYYNWVLAERKTLAAQAGAPFGGGAGGGGDLGVPGLGGWVRFARRRGMAPIPWAVEVEILVLGIGPIVLGSSMGVLLIVGIAFYVVADVVNTVRTIRIATGLDAVRRNREEQV